MKPTICLTFANSPELPLQHLKEESRKLYNILKEFQKQIQLEREESVTLEDLKQVVRQYGPALAILHYAGHAGPTSLGTEDTVTRAAALADFMQAQGIRELPLLVLNGCATQALVKKFHSIGVQAIVATSVSVDDRRASVFAVEFYQTLVSNNKNLQDAFSAGITAVNTDATKEQVHAKIYRNAGFEGKEEEIPWGLYLREGQDQMLDWTFRDAIDDPLIGLPEISPNIKLPSKPFKPLSYYQREDARVFFGRNQDIRRLYEMIEEPVGDDIILLFGQSGVGKSSLIAAGLIPRLEARWKIAPPIREDHLLHLERLFTPGTYAPEDQVLVIFDQLEELISWHPTQAITRMEAFLLRLAELLSTPERHRQLKIVLGFRKEYFAEIRGILHDAEIGFLDWQLKPINTLGIMEVVTGLTTQHYLRLKYKVALENTQIKGLSLPERIAQDISQDRQSNIAPALQILMNKLWEDAKELGSEERIFSHASYEKIKNAGLSLQEYLEKFLEQLSKHENPKYQAWAQSGLALDLLNYFLTEQKTVNKHTRKDLAQRYDHIPNWMDLLEYCRNHFLIAEYTKEQGRVNEQVAQEGQHFRLSHDALGPIVRHLFDASENPGQRAWRIINAKGDYVLQQPLNRRFSESDIEIIVQGRSGMPDIPQSLREKIEEDNKYYLDQSKKRFNLAYVSALQNYEYPKFGTAVDRLAIAQQEKHYSEKILQKAKELIYPLAYLQAEAKLKETLRLITTVLADSISHWQSMEELLQSGKFPATHLFEEIKAWFERNEPDIFLKMQERFFPHLMPIPGEALDNGPIEFEMGVKGDELVFNREGPVHMVVLDPYQLADTPVTFWQYGLYCLATQRKIPRDAGLRHGAHPVINVSWYEAIAYCNWLSQQAGHSMVYAVGAIPQDPNDWHDQINWKAVTDWNADGFRLPTEAEWELAASAKFEKNSLGQTQIGKWRFANGKDIIDSDEVNFNASNSTNSYSIEKGWMKEIRKDRFQAGTTPVKAFAQSNRNPFGLHDLSGNVHEWCWDWYTGGLADVTDQYFVDCQNRGKVYNPLGSKNGNYRLVRGGSWLNYSFACRSAYRYKNFPTVPGQNIGFRVARR